MHPAQFSMTVLLPLFVHPLCDHCYFTVGEAEEKLQSVLQVWVAMRNRQERKVWE